MTHLKVGDKAPLFTGTNQDKEQVSLTDFSGKNLILYFYPKDNTPGCTEESCNLSDNYENWLNKGYEVIGVSPDSVRKHQNFIKKFGLKFDLIADTEREIIEAYGVWGEKMMFGKKYMGVLRTTFVIDSKGVIKEIFTKVDTKDHTNQVIEVLDL